MRIGELARTAQCSVETIRYYEKEGLLPKPARSVNNYRIYASNHLRRLLFVRNCRALEISQKEVHALLGLMESAEHDCRSVIAVMDEHISHVDKRIGELRRLRDQLIDLRRNCRGQSKMRNCRILQRLSAMRIAETVGQQSGDRNSTLQNPSRQHSAPHRIHQPERKVGHRQLHADEFRQHITRVGKQVPTEACMKVKAGPIPTPIVTSAAVRGT
jgi:Cd(II)/Pb(II)-responsive transcriptional regulator